MINEQSLKYFQIELEKIAKTTPPGFFSKFKSGAKTLGKGLGGIFAPAFVLFEGASAKSAITRGGSFIEGFPAARKLV